MSFGWLMHFFMSYKTICIHVVSNSDSRHWLTQHITFHDPCCFHSASRVATMCVRSKYYAIVLLEMTVSISMTCVSRSGEASTLPHSVIERNVVTHFLPPSVSSHIFTTCMYCWMESRHSLVLEVWYQSIEKCVHQLHQEYGHNHTIHSSVCFLTWLVI